MKHPVPGAALIAVFAGVIVSANAAAQQPVAAPSVAGVYRLAQVDSTNLPALIKEGGGCREEVTAATLTLQPGNRWQLETKVRATCGETVEEKTATEQGTYNAANMVVTFQIAEPAAGTPEKAANIVLDDIAGATLKENVLTVRLREGPKSLVFRR